MSNKRVSQLIEMGASEVSGSDLFYIVDVSAGEGKRIRASTLSSYLSNSGSITAIHAETADSASFIFGSAVFGSVSSASFSNNSNHAKSASWASSSISSSYSITASYALNSVGTSNVSSSWASSSISSSYAINSVNAINAATAAFLLFVGTSNGTASYAMKAKLAESTINAETASYISGSGPTFETASYSIQSQNSNTSSLSNTASYLKYDGFNNGTASYALQAANFTTTNYRDYGIFLATTQSISSSQLDLVQVTSSNGNSASTNIESWGTIDVPYTSSTPVNETLQLIVFNRDMGTSSSLDSTPIVVNMNKIVAEWDAVVTGSITVPYSLIGSASLYGNYLIYVTGSSSRIQIDSNRTNRFNISSKSDIVNVSTYEPPMFNVTPDVLLKFTSSLGGPFFDYRDGMLITGSNNIYVLNVNGLGVYSLRYVWSLSNLTTLRCDNNPLLVELPGMPNTLQTMSCVSCSISKMFSLSNTTMSYFNCADNELTNLPELPTSLSYVNCEFNNITYISGLPNTMSYLNAGNNLISSIPSEFPFGLTQLYLNNNALTSVSASFPNSLLTMSFSNNPSLTTWISPSFPTSLKKLDVQNTLLSTIPTLPPLLTYFNGCSSSFSAGGQDLLLSQSYSNAITNNLTGSILLNGNGYITTITENTYIIPLQGFGWTIGYDGTI